MNSNIIAHLKPLEKLNFKNRFIDLGGEYYQAKNPVPAEDPYLVSFNAEGAALIDLDPAESRRPEFVQYMSGNKPLPGAQPLAMAYSGFQFGVYNSQLGDGRGLLLGEVENQKGEKWDIYLKGSGQTRFCRGFDGRATLRSSIREYLGQEALAGLGIPTTRSLAIVGIRELIYRERPELPAILVRLARSHIRFGNFDYFHYTNRPEKVAELADHVIQVHLPHLADQPEKYRLFFRFVIDRTAYLIASWQAAGFAHGVMNTDNMSILGDCFDYGPFGFMDRFKSGFVPNHSDIHGRYSYDRQPEIGHWNLAKLGETLTSLIAPNILQEELEKYQVAFNGYNSQMTAQKLGLSLIDSEFTEVAGRLYEILAAHQPDYTNFFRNLGSHRKGSLPELQKYFHQNPAHLKDWLTGYERLLEREDISPDEQQERMNRANPKFILRNYLADKAIDQAIKNADFSEVERLMLILKNPFSDQPELFQKMKIDPDLYASDTPESFLDSQVSCSA